MILLAALAVAVAQVPEAPPSPDPDEAAEEVPECPDVQRWVSIARNDTQSFFLVDARNDLLKAVDGYACGEVADPAQLGGFYSVQGLLWWYEDKPEKARRALSAAKGLGVAYDPELGEDLAPEWEAAAPPAGAPAELVLENRGDDEWLAIDGARTDASTVEQGLHLLQVGSGERARFARVVDVDAPDAVVVALPERVVVEAPPPVAVALPVPVVAPPPLVSGGALRRVNRRTYEAPDGSTLAWRPEVLSLAKTDDDGLRFRRRLRRNGILQGLVITGTVLCAYNSYLLVWDATTGRNLALNESVGGATMLGGLAVGGVLWERGLLRKRPRLRQQVADGAGRAWTPPAPEEDS